MNDSGLLIKDGPSITTGGIDVNGLKISGLGDGAISATSTDAVNGAQLFNVSEDVEQNRGNIERNTKTTQNTVAILGGTAKIGSDGALTMSDIGNTGQNTIDAAIDHNRGNIVQNTQDVAENRNQIETLAKTKGAKSEVKSGKNILVDSTTGKDGQSIYTVATKDKVAFDSATFGDTVIDKQGLRLGKDKVTLNDSGLLIKDGPSITTGGIDVNGLKISGLGDGAISATSTDAVNGAQLFNVSEDVEQNRGNIERNTKTTQNTVAILGGTAKIGSDGALTMSDIGNTGQNTIDAAIDHNRGNIVQNTQDVAENRNQIETLAKTKGAKSEVKSGKNILVDSTTGKDGQSIYTVATKDKVAFDSATFGDTVIDKQGLRLGKDKVTLNDSGLLIKDGPSITTGGIDVNGLKISGLGDGAISATSTDAVNGAQLFNVSEDVEQNRGNIVQNTQDVAENRNQIETLAKTKGAKSEVKSGKNILVDSTTGKDGQSIYTVATKDKVAFDSATFGDTVIDKQGLRLGKDKVTLNDSGLLIKDGPSITTGGIDVNGLKISGLGDGAISATSTDAVNGAQLFNVSEDVEQNRGNIERNTKTTQNTVAILGGTAKIGSDGALTMSDIGNTGQNTIDAAIDHNRGNIVQNTQDVAENRNQIETLAKTKGAKSEVKSGKNILVDSTTGKDGQSIYTVATKDKVAFDSATFGDTVIDKQGLRLGKDKVTLNDSGLLIKDGPSITTGGIDVNGLKISGLGDGAISATSTDAVNGAQLFNVSEDVEQNRGNIVQNTQDVAENRNQIETLAKTKGAKSEVKSGKNILVDSTTGKDGQSIYTVATKDKVAFDSATFGDTVIDKQGLRLGKDKVTLNDSGLLIKDGPSITTGGIDVNGLKISGLGDGAISATSTDAVNGAQLFNVSEDVEQNRGNIVQNTQDVAENRNQIETLAKTKGAKSEVKSGKNILVDSTTGKDGQSIYTVATKDKVAFDSATFGDTVIDKQGLRLGKDKVTLNDSGLLIKDGPSITTGGIDVNGLKISGLGDGAISATSTDAINGAQLFNVSEDVEQNRGNIERNTKTTQNTVAILGGTAKIGSDGALTMSDIGNTGQNTIDAAIDHNRGNIVQNTQDVAENRNQIETLAKTKGAKSEVKSGKNILVDSTTGKDGQSIYTVATKDKVAFDSATFGDTVIDKQGLRLGKDKVTLNDSGLLIKDGPSITTGGIDVNGLKISGLGDGAISATSTDAINGAQLFNVSEDVEQNRGNIERNTKTTQNTVAILGGTAKIGSDGALTMSDIGNTGQNTIDAAIDHNRGNIVQNTQDVAENRNQIETLAKTKGAKSEVKSGKNILVDSTTGKDGQSIYTVATKDKVAFDSATFGDTVIDKQGLRLGKDKVTLNDSGLLIKDGPSITTGGIDVNGLKISGLGDGAISATSTDAVNGAQLFNVSEDVEQNRGNIVQNTQDVAENRNQIETLAKTKGAKSEVKSGKNILVDSTTGKDGQSIYTVATKDKVAFDSATFGDTVIDKQGLRLGKDKVTLNDSGLLIKDGPSITTGGIDVNGLKISGLGDGAISATSTDAVNGAQLFNVSEDVEQNRGNIVQNTQDVAENRNQIETLAKTKGAKSEVKSGKNILVDSTTGKDGQSIYTVATKDKVAFDSATFGDTVIDKQGLRLGKDKVTLNDSGLLIKDGPSITTGGIDVNGLKISGLGDGAISATSTDAVNGAQLFNVSEDVRQISKQIKTQQNTIDKFVGWNIVSDENGKQNSQKIKIGNQGQIHFNGNENLIVKIKGKDNDAEVNLALKPNPKVDTLTATQSVTVGASVINTSGLTIEDGPSMKKNGIDGGGKKIRHIKAGELSETSTDAITGGQLFATNQNVAANKQEIDHLISHGVAQGIANGSAGIVQYSDKEAPTLPNGNKKSNDVTLVGKTSEQAVTIHNVGAGRTNTDAVNLGQLHATEGRLNDRLNSLDVRVRAGIASALASAALPQAYLARESVISAATSNYRGEQALSIGASTVSPNGRWIVKGTANFNHEDASVALGIGYKF